MKNIIFIPIILLVGCAGRVVHMENDRGDEITCEVSNGSAFMTGMPIRDSAIERCIEIHEDAGFKVTYEEE